MIRTSDDLEAQLGRLGRRYERTPDGTFILSLGANQPPAALLLVPPVLVVQVAVGSAPKDDVAAAPLYSCTPPSGWKVIKSCWRQRSSSTAWI